MYLIAGLGNPEEEYGKTRHNMGFDTINILAEKYHMEFTRKKFDSYYDIGKIEGEKVVLLKPQTFMNLSGIAIRQWLQFYQLTSSELVVIYDDMDIEPGKIKIRKKGGPGSHNGMKSVVQEIKTEDFYRIRIGIGKPERKEEAISYVIGNVPEKERTILKQGTQLAAEAVVSIVKEGIDISMNKFN